MGLAETKEASLGKKMGNRGDFNDIIGPEDKQGGRRRVDSSFIPFRAFINNIEMEDVLFKGRRWTWANNRVGKGFIEERLDMVFGSAEWLAENGKAEVQHFLKHSSDHAMVLLDSHPNPIRSKIRFIYDHRWSTVPGCREVVQSS